MLGSLEGILLLCLRRKAASVLGWVVKENRYKLTKVESVLMATTQNTSSMPYIVVIVDEMSDLMLVSEDIEIIFKNFHKWQGHTHIYNHGNTSKC